MNSDGKQRCPVCGSEQPLTISDRFARPPRPGDHAVCYDCAAVSVYDEQWRELSDREKIDVRHSPAWPEIEILVEQALEGIRQKKRSIHRAN